MLNMPYLVIIIREYSNLLKHLKCNFAIKFDKKTSFNNLDFRKEFKILTTLKTRTAILALYI